MIEKITINSLDSVLGALGYVCVIDTAGEYILDELVPCKKLNEIDPTSVFLVATIAGIDLPNSPK
jgi:hypothetical protein